MHVSEAAKNIIKKTLAYYCNPLRLTSRLLKPFLFKPQETITFALTKKIDLNTPQLVTLKKLIIDYAGKKKIDGEITALKSPIETIWQQENLWCPQGFLKLSDATYAWAINTRDISFADALVTYVDLVFLENPFNNNFFLFERDHIKMVETYTQFYLQLKTHLTKMSIIIDQSDQEPRYLTNINSLRSIAQLPALKTLNSSVNTEKKRCAIQ